MRSDQNQSFGQPPQSTCEADFYQKTESSARANPYAGLYSDELPDAVLRDQSAEIQLENEEAPIDDSGRKLPSRSSDIVSENQSDAEEVASNDLGAGSFAEEEF